MRVIQHGYVIQWSDGTIQPQTFRPTRHGSWMELTGARPGWHKRRRDWKKRGAICVYATVVFHTRDPRRSEV